MTTTSSSGWFTGSKRSPTSTPPSRCWPGPSTPATPCRSPSSSHTLTAFTTALPADRQTQQALAAENEQLRRALATRDVIGQAKGILTERYNIDATAAFDLLIKLSQDSNSPVTEVARTLIELDHPPNTRHTT